MQATLPFKLTKELLKSVVGKHGGFALTAAQRHEAQERLTTHRRNPNAPTFTLAQIKASLNIA
jgi:hypothetical protein